MKSMRYRGAKSILWYIMKTHSIHGVNDLMVYFSYEGYVIKEYFSNYFLHQSEVTFCMKNALNSR